MTKTLAAIAALSLTALTTGAHAEPITVTSAPTGASIGATSNTAQQVASQQASQTTQQTTQQSVQQGSVVSAPDTRQDLSISTPRQPVATAYAAPLSFSSGTCYVSASAGGQGVTFGLSAAIPVEDKGCTVRAYVQTLVALGERAAALEYLSSRVPDVRAALASTGH